jgi:RimJ/RimL family protein N-acetyltransferase
MSIKLETERLILREPKLSDWKDIVEGIGDVSVSEYLATAPSPYKKKDALGWIKKEIKLSKEKKRKSYKFLIKLKSEKKIIGNISISNINYDSEISENGGAWINKRYQKRGYITEAKIAAIEFAFNKLKLRKLETGAYSDNLASNKTQKKMGYKLEGCRKKHHISKATGKIHDENIYGLMKEDWKKNLPKLKKHLDKKIKAQKNI